jgi:glycosyltransferase involved in cell wall biosynthesis
MQSHVFSLTQSFSQLGHEVVVVTKPQPATKFHERNGLVDVVRIPFLKVPRTMSLQYVTGAAAYLTWLVLTWKPDILHVHSFWPELLATKHLHRRVRIVHTAHESLFLIMAAQPRYHRRLRFIFSKIDGLIGPSDELIDVARKFGVPVGRSMFLSNGVDAERFSPQTKGLIRKRYAVADTTQVVLCPRRLVPKNGVKFLLGAVPEILRQHPETLIVIVGEGPERAALQAQCAALGIQEKVIFAGAIANDEINRYYADADLVVLPSLKEATSIAALEAMASAKPIVATDVGGLPYLVTDGVTGLLVTPADTTTLAHAINELLAVPARRSQMGKAARDRVLHELTWDHVAQRTLDFYARVLRQTEATQN